MSFPIALLPSWVSCDGKVIIIARGIRGFAQSYVAILLALYLKARVYIVQPHYARGTLYAVFGWEISGGNGGLDILVLIGSGNGLL